MKRFALVLAACARIGATAPAHAAEAAVTEAAACGASGPLCLESWNSAHLRPESLFDRAPPGRRGGRGFRGSRPPPGARRQP